MPDRIGKYQIVERIGRGGMGTVYKARDTQLNRLVALKIISPEVEITPELRTRFFAEAQLCAGLNHPNIVTIYDSGEEADRLYIVMELLDGQELRRTISERVQRPIEEKLSLMIQLCDALGFAHEKGVIHRDIKPSNIFLQRTGPVKIIDFGIAKMPTSSSMTRAGLIMGTIRYMSPEQVRGRADQRSDQFSLASVFYELLSFRPPYLGEDPFHLLEQLRTERPPSLVELDRTIPFALAQVVERGMNKVADDRYPNLRAMRNDLEVVRREFREEAQRLRAEFATLVAGVRDAETRLTRRLGGPAFDSPMEVANLPSDVVALRDGLRAARERLKVIARYSRRIDALEPAFSRGSAALKSGSIEQARRAFQEIVVELPEHANVRALLDDLQAGKNLRLLTEAACELLEEVHQHLVSEDPAHELLAAQPTVDSAAPVGADGQNTSPRRSGAGLQPERKESDLAEHQGTKTREHTFGATTVAEARFAATPAMEVYPPGSSECPDEAKSSEVLATTSERHSRRAAQQARMQMKAMRTQAQAAGAAIRAADAWDEGGAKESAGAAAFLRESFSEAHQLFDSATTLFRRALNEARRSDPQLVEGSPDASSGIDMSLDDATAVANDDFERRRNGGPRDSVRDPAIDPPPVAAAKPDGAPLPELAPEDATRFAVPGAGGPAAAMPKSSQASPRIIRRLPAQNPRRVRYLYATIGILLLLAAFASWLA